jgi:transcriptional regulator with XRE-family HTH domain
MATQPLKLTQAELARELGVDKSQITRWKDRGAPINDGVQAVREWREATLLDRGSVDRFDDGDDNISIDDIEFVLPEGSNATDVLARMEKSERRLSGIIEAWEKSKPNPKLSAKLVHLRREHRETSKLVIAAHKAILEMEQQKNILVEWETADKFVLGVLAEILKFPHKIPSRGNDEAQRILLKQVAADFQQVISEASTTAAKKARE